MMTSTQLAAAIQNAKHDKEFWSDPERVARWEREMNDYEEFCRKFGRAHDDHRTA